MWFPDDPHQVPWQTFLDEVVQAGYSRIELGPHGYLPTDAEQLRDELGRRGLTLTGGAVFAASTAAPRPSGQRWWTTGRWRRC